MKAIFKRELRALLGSFRGWGAVALVLLGAAISVTVTNLTGGAPRFELNAGYIALSYIPAAALATMGSFAADRRQNTERLMYSLPVSVRAMVAGKLLALMGPVLMASAGLCLFPLFLRIFGVVAMPAAYASILGLTLLGAACMAVGLFVSCCSPNQVVSFLLTVLVLGLSWAAPYAADRLNAMTSLGIPMLLACMLLVFAMAYQLSGSGILGIILAAAVEIPLLLSYFRGTSASVARVLARMVRAAGLFDGMNPFINGLLDGRVLVYYLTVALLFAVFTVLYVANRRQARRRALS